MGHPLKDNQRDFGNHPFTEIPEGSLEYIRKRTKEMSEAVISTAIKNDSDKTRMDLLPPKALEGIGKIFTFGAKKYADYNYKNGEGLDWNRPYAAALRHLNAWNDGKDNDTESGESHLYHAGCCIMMLIDLIESGKGKDTRFDML